MPRPPKRTTPIGALLADWLEENNATAGWLAQQAGISAKHLSQVMTGHAAFSVGVAVRLANVTGLSATTLFRLQNDRLIEIEVEKHQPPT